MGYCTPTIESDWGVRYWEDYSNLQSIKNYWDPSNTFNHCHSVGSTDNTCCPDYQSTENKRPACATVDGRQCVFPFNYNWRRYDSCTYSGYYWPWCATSVNIFGGKELVSTF